MMKKILLAGLLLVFAVMGIASLAQDDVFRIAALMPSATNDLAFSQSMYDALVAIQEELGEEAFEFTIQDSTYIVDDAAVALRDWAASGEFQLVIAHGSQYGPIVEELAAEFNDVSFAWGTRQDTFGMDNVYSYAAASDEGGYFNGVLAAHLTETGVVGLVGPIEVGDGKLYADGFANGVASVDEEIDVNIVFIGSFSDVPLATEAAETHIANGADVLTGTAQMVVGPIAVAVANDVLWFGSDASQDELSEDIGVAFQIYKWDVLLLDMIANIKDGVLGGEYYKLTLENEGLVMEFDKDFEISDELMAAAEETLTGIILGDIIPIPEMMADEMAEEEDED
ncbi:MAG: BMP family ABC transporter substrate-binding protein [Chloroflexi bacterium]|nr:BMP family ABC transporter substrate-binding protein [Chloroflexota bacterium]